MKNIHLGCNFTNEKKIKAKHKKRHGEMKKRDKEKEQSGKERKAMPTSLHTLSHFLFFSSFLHQKKS